MDFFLTVWGFEGVEVLAEVIVIYNEKHAAWFQTTNLKAKVEEYIPCLKVRDHIYYLLISPYRKGYIIIVIT